MKKYCLKAMLGLLFVVVIFASCQTQEKKVENAQQDVKDAKEDLKEALSDNRTEAEKIAFEKEWKLFRAETELSIQENDKRIAALKTQMKATGKSMDIAYGNKIDTLQMQNRKMYDKMNEYNSAKTNWETFKREFNNDMSNLGKALKDFSINNKN